MKNFFFVLCAFLSLNLIPPRCYAENSCDRAEASVIEASKVRGLKPKAFIDCHSVDKDQFLRLASHLIESDTDVKNLKEHGLALYYQGLIPKEYDYAKCILPALATNAAAFYSWKLKFFVVPNWIETPQVVLVHEAVHALQDQYYPVRHYAEKKFIFDDENMAQGAILEGDAFSLEESFLDTHPNEPADPDSSGKIALLDPACELPMPLQTMFDRMYQDGGIYMKEIRSRGMKQVDMLFKKPIKTTKAIVDKSLSDNPYSGKLSVSVSSPVLKGKIGVFGVNAFLEQKMPPNQAKKIANELVDDTFAINKKGDYEARYKFSSEQSATEFFNYLKFYWQNADIRPFQKGTDISLRHMKE